MSTDPNAWPLLVVACMAIAAIILLVWMHPGRFDRPDRDD